MKYFFYESFYLELSNSNSDSDSRRNDKCEEEMSKCVENDH